MIKLEVFPALSFVAFQFHQRLVQFQRIFIPLVYNRRCFGLDPRPVQVACSHFSSVNSRVTLRSTNKDWWETIIFHRWRYDTARNVGDRSPSTADWKWMWTIYLGAPTEKVRIYVWLADSDPIHYGVAILHQTIAQTTCEPAKTKRTQMHPKQGGTTAKTSEPAY